LTFGGTECLVWLGNKINKKNIQERKIRLGLHGFVILARLDLIDIKLELK